MGQPVNVDTFVRAETARMFDGILAQSGWVNAWMHMRGPVALDSQTVIRMNRDTLKPGVDLTRGDCGGASPVVVAHAERVDRQVQVWTSYLRRRQILRHRTLLSVPTVNLKDSGRRPSGAMVESVSVSRRALMSAISGLGGHRGSTSESASRRGWDLQ